MPEGDQNLLCSFCNKGRKDVTKMIVGASKVCICNECIKLCNEILFEDNKKVVTEQIRSGEKGSLNPVRIKEYLDDYVIGQDKAKTVMSVAVCNHYKRILNPPKDFDLEKSNVIILGASGSGKTLLAKTIAKYLDVPFAMADATSLTEAGYVGDDVENVISKLYQNANGDKHLTERGIVFIDEIDKICKKSESTSITRDVSGEGVQQGLLKIVEGTTCRVPPHGGRKHPDGQNVEIDTTNILFVVGGAFNDLEKQIKRKSAGSIGFGADVKTDDTKNYLADVKPEDLMKFGLIPELVGRLPVSASLNELSLEDLKEIITRPKNAISKQYKALFSFEGVEFEITEDGREQIAQLAVEKKIGARGLRSIMEKLLLDCMYDIPDKDSVDKVVLSKESVISNRPIIVYKEKAKIKKKVGEN